MTVVREPRSKSRDVSVYRDSKVKKPSRCTTPSKDKRNMQTIEVQRVTISGSKKFGVSPSMTKTIRYVDESGSKDVKLNAPRAGFDQIFAEFITGLPLLDKAETKSALMHVEVKPLTMSNDA